MAELHTDGGDPWLVSKANKALFGLSKKEWLLLNECAATRHDGPHKTTCCCIQVVKLFRCHFIYMF